MPDDIREQASVEPFRSSEEEKEIEEILDDSVIGEIIQVLDSFVLDLSPSDPKDDTPPISTDIQCRCGAVTRHICHTCRSPFCSACASIIDPAFCRQCLNEDSIEIKIEDGVKDTNGISHEGHTLHVSGPLIGTTAKRICEKSKYELEATVHYYKDLIRQSERKLDTQRVILGMHQIELAEREDQIRRHFPKGKLRSVTVRMPGAEGDANATPKTKSQRRERTDTVTQVAQALGVNNEAAAGFLQSFMTLLAAKPPKEEKK